MVTADILRNRKIAIYPQQFDDRHEIWYDDAG